MRVIERSLGRWAVLSHTKPKWHYVKRYRDEAGKEIFECDCEWSIYRELDCQDIKDVKNWIRKV